MDKTFSIVKSILERTNLIIRVAMVIAALPFFVLGLTLLPVVGLLIGFAVVALALSPLGEGVEKRIVDVLVGYRRHSHVCDFDSSSGATVPVAILSTRSLDAKRVDPSSVVMDHHQRGDLPYRSALVQDGNCVDLVLCVPETDLSSVKDLGSACIEGRTIDGEPFRGCTTIYD